MARLLPAWMKPKSGVKDSQGASCGRATTTTFCAALAALASSRGAVYCRPNMTHLCVCVHGAAGTQGLAAMPMLLWPHAMQAACASVIMTTTRVLQTDLPHHDQPYLKSTRGVSADTGSSLPVACSVSWMGGTATPLASGAANDTCTGTCTGPGTCGANTTLKLLLL